MGVHIFLKYIFFKIRNKKINKYNTNKKKYIKK